MKEEMKKPFSQEFIEKKKILKFQKYKDKTLRE